MLSAFTARPIIELRQRDKSKIETILAYGDRVLVGLNTGSLRVYRLNELPSAPPRTNKQDNGTSIPQTDVATEHAGSRSASESAKKPGQNVTSTGSNQKASTKPTDLLWESEKFSSRAIEQLAIIKEANILVSLSNYAVSLHDLQTLEPIESPLAGTKNASTFAVTSNIVKDPATGIPEIISRLAVAIKRRLLLWSWNESEISPEAREIVLSETIRTITWASATRLVCGMNGGYVLVDVESRAVYDIFATTTIGGTGGGQGTKFGATGVAGMGYMGLGGYVPKPLAAKLADNELLLAKDINTLFIDDTGKPLEKRQIPWGAAPEAIGYSYPYIIALQSPSKGSLEVRNPDTLSLLQTINLPGASALHFPPPTVSLAHAGKGFHVISDRVVWKMDATDYDSQIQELVEDGKYDEAISILGMLEDALLKNKRETLREVKMLKAEYLFKQKKYRESMDLFNEEEVHAPPERVLKLFPRVISGNLSGVPEPKEDYEPPQDGGPGGNTNGDAASKLENAKPEIPAEAASPQKGGGFAKYIMGQRKLNPETASIVSSKKSQEEDDAASTGGSIKGKGKSEKSQEEKDLMAAVLELNSYLAGARARLQRVLDPVTGKLKRRKPQNGTADDAFKTLLTSSNDESDEKLENDLRDTFRLIDTTLFRAYIYSSPALASSLFRIPNFCDPDVVNEKLIEASRYNELVDFFYGKKLHRQALELLKKFGSSDMPDEASPSLHGPQRTVMYLQNLPPEMIDLILEYSEWTLRKDPKLGMEVFLADSENAETMPRGRVVKFLENIDAELEMQYLEHIISELKDKTPEFHNRLVDLLIRRLKERPKDDDWDRTMERLIQFLQESQEYGRLRAFNLIPRDDPSFYEAQAVVLSRMEQHKQALEIYVFKMNNYRKAEDYCNRIHRSQEASETTSATSGLNNLKEEEQEPSIYHTLLTLYLNPPPGQTRQLQAALDLLSKHGSRLSAESTLPLIPDTLPVAELESYFRGRMRSANSVINELRIVAGLQKTQLVASQALLLLGDNMSGGRGGKNRRVVISDERVCGVCHKRLGGSVVAAMPDNSVVHYGCLARARSTVTGGPGPAAAHLAGQWARTGGGGF
ncbi:hypothetical protein VTK73DRAFT_747 [Phialemonium thermophilum]|uniref:CNH domain-containing protein n=1 Tax=Phialemonium thermophilum TaxID=223376 RepID=A0ABR3VUE8_9PEZI